ncbi:low choriolytic enzyme-like isoform X1 [Nerophis ophidion]|uniref:low choriolytic enzyme-like isoform X1 n=2 Tax=Nerophis ophidion TaxID=159077 RepID=UPI002ADFA345|nr:low choriolytic enzyme-like isoform X1 [Nerophis ophidion]XP_061757085.1 low choriolytic enzyme-like isoform X1 [Nerophis ophidion]XP_061757086.1 low choriolytic enzyme-like isoform X1 [Nerophis ophidion]
MHLKSLAFVLLLKLITFSDALPDETQEVDNGDLHDKDDSTDTILKMNKGSSEIMLEGDLMLPRTRTAMKCYTETSSCLWRKSNNGNVEIPFVISDNYDAGERNTIVTSLKSMQAKTCIRFIPRTNQRDYISYEPRYGCSSMMGRMGDKQVVALQRFGCIQHGIILHETMHAMGFYHEHTRSDRDSHVRINWDNIETFNAYNFQKQKTNNLNVPYDYKSLMHYGRNAFGIKDRDTITPIPDASVEIGQRKRLSDYDILRINRLYKCRN